MTDTTHSASQCPFPNIIPPLPNPPDPIDPDFITCHTPTPLADLEFKSWSSANLTLSPVSPCYTDQPKSTSSSITPFTSSAGSTPQKPNPTIGPRTTSLHTPMTSSQIHSHPRPSSSPDAIRRPFMSHAKFGSSANWALDIFSLPHNAVRAECVDLYNILESIQARLPTVHHDELDEFFMWWNAFEVFVIEYFDFEADVLFTWTFPSARDDSIDVAMPDVVSEKVNAEIALKNKMLARKEHLLESLRQINGTFELRRHIDILDVFHTILDEVNDFVPKLIDYFSMQEKHLPQFMTHFHSPSAKEVITRKYIAYIKHGEDPQMNLTILTRWMDTALRERWVRANVKGFTRLLYPRWERRCTRAHLHIPYKFHRRLLRSVRNVAASRLRRRTEYGEDIDDLSFGSFVSQGGSFKSLTLGLPGRHSNAVHDRRSRESSNARTRTR